MRRNRFFVNLELILLLAIVAAGVFLRLVAQNHLRVISPDGVFYISHASSVLEGEGGFGVRGAFFQLLLMISFNVFGANFESSVVIPQFFGSIIPILLFLLGKHFFDSKTGLIAALLGSLNPILINLSCWVLRETLTLALILMTILTAHSTTRIESKKRSLIATILPGFLSGLVILTRDEMIFVIPAAYIAYIYFYEKKRLDFVVRTSIFLATAILILTPWLLYSSAYFGNPFHSYWRYLDIFGAPKGVPVGTPEGVEGVSVPFFLRLHVILRAVFFGLWREIAELPTILSLFGFMFLPIGFVFTIRKRAIWMIYFILGLGLLLPAYYASMEVFFYKLVMPFRWIDPIGRITSPTVMPVIVIIAYGIRRLISFPLDLER